MMTRDLEHFPNRLKMARAYAGMSQLDLALTIGRKTGTAFTLISKYEHGEVRPRLERACEIADVLGVRVEWLLFGTGDMHDEI